MSGAYSRPRLLVVDDEPELAELIGEIARRAGYEVTVTSIPSEFERLYDDTLDVIVLDLWMPGTDGIEIVRQLAERQSRARLVLVSGFDEKVLDAAARVAVSYGLNLIGSLTKPVRLATLTQLLDTTGMPDAQAASRALRVTLAELQQAFANDELVVHYQPQVSMRSGEVVGAEALVRWRQRNGRLILPEMFVQVVEDSDLAQALTWRVLEKAAGESALLPGLTLSINLPLRSLGDVTFPDRVVSRLHGTPLAPQQIHFEITETSVASEATSALDILTRLRLKGFSLAIDDFGRGYSSLEQLRHLPFSGLKIDRGFVRRMDRDPASRVIVENCIALGRDLGLTVVAEGAETRAIWLALAQAGCDIVQGYYVMHPAPAAEIAEWRRTWSLSGLPAM